MKTCAICGEELTGRIGDPMGWTWRGCPLGEDDEGNYPCIEQRGMGAKVNLSSGYFVTLEALLDCSPAFLAHAANLTLDELLEQVQRWADHPTNLMYGVQVDREAKTITQAGRA